MKNACAWGKKCVFTQFHRLFFLSCRQSLQPPTFSIPVFKQVLGLSFSVFTTAAISAERYLAVCRPFYPGRERASILLLAAVAATSLAWTAYQVKKIRTF